MHAVRRALLVALFCVPLPLAAQTRPFGTLREQADLQQGWLAERLDAFLAPLMRRDSIDMWIMPMREYAEDPVFTALAGPTTFAARRRTIYVFFDRGDGGGIERLALGGSSQGGVFTVLRAEGIAAAGARVQRAELWGDEQWRLLRRIVDQRKPRRIAVNTSRVFAFSDGITAGEHDALLEALGPQWRKRIVPAERLAVDLLAVRLPGEAEVFADMVKLNWALIDTMFSSKAVIPGTTRPSDLVWWFRQRVNDLGLGTWFQPSVTVQRQGASADELGDDPIIQRGDVLHCDVGITVLGLNTDIQHMGYVLRPGESDAPAGLKAALAPVEPAAGHRPRRVAPGPQRERDPRRRAGPHGRGGHRRQRLLAPDRAARAWRRTAHRAVGPAGGSPGPRRSPRDPAHLVLDRAAGGGTRARVGRAAGALGAGGGRGPRCRWRAGVGVATADGVSSGPLRLHGTDYRTHACRLVNCAGSTGSRASTSPTSIRTRWPSSASGWTRRCAPTSRSRTR